MSQRLHIGNTSETFYDCVLMDRHDAPQKLLSEWLAYEKGALLGPWKIRIGDIDLFRSLEPLIVAAFRNVGKEYPDDVWAFYLEDSVIEHPSAEELMIWISANGG